MVERSMQDISSLDPACFDLISYFMPESEEDPLIELEDFKNVQVEDGYYIYSEETVYINADEIYEYTIDSSTKLRPLQSMAVSLDGTDIDMYLESGESIVASDVYEDGVPLVGFVLMPGNEYKLIVHNPASNSHACEYKIVILLKEE